MDKDKRDAICGYTLAIAIVLLVIWSINHSINLDRANHRNAYTAWVKYTENTNKLTYKEWTLLYRKDLLHNHGVEEQWQK